MSDTGVIEGKASLVGEKPAPNERCGNCRFAHSIVEDLAICECHGVPPTPAVMGMGPQGPAVGLLRARLPRVSDACALWKLKSSLVM